jgi:hypothetical protein
MKSKIFLSIAVFLVSFQIHAQFFSNNVQPVKYSLNEIGINPENLQQKNSDNINKKHKFYLGIFSSVDYSHFEFDNTYSVLISTEKTHGFQYGLKLQYNMNENLSFRSGLSYSIYYHDFIYYYNGLDSLNFASNYHKGAYTGWEYHKLMFWNLPLMFGYTVFKDEKFKFTPSAGLILSIDPINSYFKSYAQLNLGCEYFINNVFFLTVEPYFKNYMNIKMMDNFTNEDPKSGFGFILSANFKL